MQMLTLSVAPIALKPLFHTKVRNLRSLAWYYNNDYRIVWMEVVYSEYNMLVNSFIKEWLADQYIISVSPYSTDTAWQYHKVLFCQIWQYYMILSLTHDNITRYFLCDTWQHHKVNFWHMWQYHKVVFLTHGNIKRCFSDIWQNHKVFYLTDDNITRYLLGHMTMSQGTFSDTWQCHKVLFVTHDYNQLYE